MFKLSNNSIQVKQLDLNKTLLITSDQIILIGSSHSVEAEKLVYSK